MKNADIVVVGGSAAGLTAAITARRHHPDKKVLLIRREQKVLIPCGIPYVFGTLGSPEKNLIPDALLEKNGIELRIAEVQSIDPAAKQVRANDETIGYERLVLAMGSRPARLPVGGLDLDGVFAVEKDIAHLKHLQQVLESARHVVTIGGGFIGIEFADEINKLGGKQVTVVEIAPRCLSASYDDAFCEQMERHLGERGVAVRTSATVEAITGDGRVEQVQLRDGSVLRADVVVLGIGAAPNTDLAAAAGLRLGPLGGIAVDRTLRTSDPAIFACGDCAEKTSFFGGGPSALKLASIAQVEGRIAGANLFGLRRESPGTVGVWSTAVGELAMATAGLTETAAEALGYRTVSATVEGPNRHPGGMPGAAPMRVKLVFEASTRTLLGGQISGSEPVGELINVVAACVQKRMSAEDVATFQMGTHPALTASPIAYPLVNAAELALVQIR